MKRPDMRDYFRARIDWKVNGMLARSRAVLPPNVVSIDGDVDSSMITVTMQDGTIYRWTGGRYALRKVNGCYAPLMPAQVKE